MKLPECEYRNDLTDWEWKRFDWNKQRLPLCAGTVRFLDTILHGDVYLGTTDKQTAQEVRMR